MNFSDLCGSYVDYNTYYHYRYKEREREKVCFTEGHRSALPEIYEY